MSSTRQAVTRGPSFTGLGKRPDLTPSHQQDFFTGMMGGIGGFALESPMIWGSRRNPVSGSECICIRPCVIEDGYLCITQYSECQGIQKVIKHPIRLLGPHNLFNPQCLAFDLSDTKCLNAILFPRRLGGVWRDAKSVCHFV